MDYESGHQRKIKCPYGKPGDLLWVREEHYRIGHWEPVPGVKTKGGKQKWAFVADSDEVRYCDNAPDFFCKARSRKDPETSCWHKRLARFMPRALSRTTLEVTEIRVERLQDITEEDAKQEGPTQHPDYPDYFYCLWVTAFRHLWCSINGKESWDANPWVWVVGFVVVKK